MNRIYSKSDVIKMIVSLGIPLVYIFAVWKVTGLYFETNDDRVIAEILSGTLTGRPEAHTVFLNYFLSCLLSLLYHVSGQISWYGCMFVLCHFAIYAALLYSIWPQKKSVLEYIFCIGIVCCFSLVNIYLTSVVQFTSTAALLAVTGYVCLILQKDFKRGWWFFFFFELAAFLLRSEAMLMVLPVGGYAYAGLCLADQSIGKREQCQKIGRVILSIGIVVVIGFLGNLIGYHGKEWGAYTRFNKARAELFDYSGYSAYEEVKPILDKYDVTQTEYEAFYRYVILDDKVSAECVEELAEYAESRQKKELDVIDLAGQVWRPDRAAEYLKTEQVTVSRAVWLSILLWIFLWRKFYLLIPLSGIAFSKTVVWGYLLYRGRLPLRITNPLFACEILLIVTLFAWDYLRQENDRKQKIFAASVFAVFALCSISAGKMQYHQAVRANEWQDLYMQGLVDIQSYCRENPDNRYLLDCGSFGYYTGSVFETRIYGSQNYVYTGNWFSKSPVLRRHLEEYFAGGGEEVYFIILETEDVWESPGVAFLTEKFGVPPTLVDQITVSHGGNYLVLYFGK